MGTRLQAVGRNKKARRYHRMLEYAEATRRRDDYIGLVVIGTWRLGCQVRQGVDMPAWIDTDPCPGLMIGYIGPKDGKHRWTIVSTTPWVTTPGGTTWRYRNVGGESIQEMKTE